MTIEQRKAAMSRFEYGQVITLDKPASWRNFGSETITHPAGTKLRIETAKPEGFDCRTEDGEFFFLFAEDLPD